MANHVQQTKGLTSNCTPIKTTIFFSRSLGFLYYIKTQSSNYSKLLDHPKVQHKFLSFLRFLIQGAKLKFTWHTESYQSSKSWGILHHEIHSHKIKRSITNSQEPKKEKEYRGTKLLLLTNASMLYGPYTSMKTKIYLHAASVPIFPSPASASLDHFYYHPSEEKGKTSVGTRYIFKTFNAKPQQNLNLQRI